MIQQHQNHRFKTDCVCGVCKLTLQVKSTSGVEDLRNSDVIESETYNLNEAIAARLKQYENR